MDKIVGYTAMTEYVYGDDLSWKVEELFKPDEERYMPDIYPTLREVQVEIVQEQKEQLNQFIAGNREWHDIQWAPDSYPVYIEIKNDKIQCWTDEHKEHRVYCNELTNWRENI